MNDCRLVTMHDIAASGGHVRKQVVVRYPDGSSIVVGSLQGNGARIFAYNRDGRCIDSAITWDGAAHKLADAAAAKGVADIRPIKRRGTLRLPWRAVA